MNLHAALHFFLGTHPALLPLVLFVPLYAGTLAPAFRLPAAWRQQGVLALGCLTIGSFVACCGVYAADSSYSGHVEPAVAAVSWLYQTGHQLYPGPAAAELYGNLYGPLLYVIYGAALWLMGPSIAASKLCAAAAACLALACLYQALRGILAPRLAFAVTAGVTLLLLTFGTVSFRVRADPLLLACVCLGLLAALRTGPRLALPLCALTAGVSVAIKAHAWLYFLPIYGLIQQRYGARYTVAALGGTLLVALLPFLDQARVSLPHYLLFLQGASGYGYGIARLQRMLESFACLLEPLLLLAWIAVSANRHGVTGALRQNRPFVCGLAVSALAIALIGAKTGPHHWVPLMPALAYLAALLLASIQPGPVMAGSTYRLAACLAASLLVSCMLCAAYSQYKQQQSARQFDGTAIANDLAGIVQAHPGRDIQMGYGSSYYDGTTAIARDYHLAFFRPLLVFSGSGYLLDAVALMDNVQAGRTIPAATRAAMQRCRGRIWLLPRGSRPFRLASYYYPYRQLFDDRFRAAFLENHEPRGHSRYFDLWSCKADG